jgi:hypothetical protein
MVRKWKEMIMFNEEEHKKYLEQIYIDKRNYTFKCLQDANFLCTIDCNGVFYVGYENNINKLKSILSKYFGYRTQEKEDNMVIKCFETLPIEVNKVDNQYRCIVKPSLIS